MRRVAFTVLLAALASVFPVAAPATLDARQGEAMRSSRSKVNSLERQVDSVERMVRRMERSARHFKWWMTCLTRVPVSEYGDPDHRFGFQYDERDGTGLDHRPALAVDTRRRGNPDYRFLAFEHRARCQSDPTVPGTPAAPGTADPASLNSRRPVARTSSTESQVRTLERRLVNLARRADRLERMSEQFDEFESCTSWTPVTEYGDPAGGFGYVYKKKRGAQSTYRPALAIDISEWDDPDYMFLASDCDDEPGEAVD